MFAADGSLIAAGTLGGVVDSPGPAPVTTAGTARVADLASRYRQPDGLAVDLTLPGRRLALPVDRPDTQVLVVSAAVGGGGSGPSLVVMVLPLPAADDAETMQRALGAVLAHELRTPMTAIVAGAELIASDRMSEEARREAARAVGRETERLRTTVENLLTLLRPAGPVAELEPVLLQAVAKAVVERARRVGGGANADVRIPADLPPIMGSEAVVEQVLGNAVAHATHAGSGWFGIEARALDDRVDVRVDDDGPVRGDDRDAAFDLFASGPRASRDPSGANLAMAVTRNLAERIGASVRTESSTRGERTVLSFAVAGEDGLR